MPLTDIECPNCGGFVHSDGILDAEHALGCGEELPQDIIREYWGF